MTIQTVLYASVGSRMLQYQVDVESGVLNELAELKLPDIVQYACVDQNSSYLYAACSDGNPRASGSHHCLVALRIDPRTGVLSAHGKEVELPRRAVHLTLDATCRYALVAYNNPPAVYIHRIASDGRLEAAPGEMQNIDAGHYPHQIRVTPSNKLAVVVSRGTRPELGGKPGTPGALKIASFSDGKLAMHASIEPEGGVNFGPRNLDFHPNRPWVYVALEFQNKLYMFNLEKDEFSPSPMFVRETLVNPTFVAPRQMAGAVHVHPNGKTVYVINRCDGTADFEGRPVYSGGDNTLAVYAINQKTGEPTLIQAEDTLGMHARTFSIEPSGRLIAVAHNNAVEMRNASSTGSRVVPGGLTVFRVLDDGKLKFLHRYELSTDSKNLLYWSKLLRING